jgi:multiple sugar transport system substrate-binding protein
MSKRRALVAVAAALAITACGSSGDNGGSNAANFDPNPTGTFSAWGFNNADDVGKARLAYAAQQLGGLKVEMDQTNFDAQKFTTRLASDNVPDVVQWTVNTSPRMPRRV